MLRLQIRHSYYKDGESREDYTLQPSAATADLFRRLGFLFRATPNGAVIYAEVRPDSDPAELRTAIGQDALQVTLLLYQQNPRLEQYTALPPHRPAATVFYTANLRSDVAESRFYLTDPSTGKRLGDAIELVTSPNLVLVIPSEAPKIMSFTNIFGKKWDPIPFQVTQHSAGSTELCLDLTRVAGLIDGRYTISDDRGNEHEIYYSRTPVGGSLLGIVELFSRTESLSLDGSDRVPAEYHFISGETVNPITYWLEFKALATVWRYRVTKRFAKAPTQLDTLSIAGNFLFTRTLQDQCAVFTSEGVIPLTEKPQQLELQRSGTTIQTLPDPVIGNSLQKGASTGSFVSEMNVYV